MKSIKLLTLTSRWYLLIFLALTLFFFAAFFVSIQREVRHSTNEILHNRKAHILEKFGKSDGTLPSENFGYSDFQMTLLTGNPSRADRYIDTLIFETVDQHLDEFRKLNSIVQVNGKSYLLEIIIAKLETHEIVESVAKSLIVVFIIMTAIFYFSLRYFSRKLWAPFYNTLQQLNAFEVDQSKELELTPGRIEEFVALDKSIKDLTERTQKTFINQKQFIENASHEMQTPLAITQSKLELLIGDPNLTQHQSEIVQTLINSTQRLARLNKTLLLLSKIENQQFLEKENVNLKVLVTEILSYFEEQQENLKIKVTREESNEVSVVANRVLVDLLLTNLIKNAFFHNQNNGNVHIKLSDNRFSISNTSSIEAIPAEKIFQRFFKQSTNKDSWGLGLAIVKKICDLNQWGISYSKNEGLHSFVVVFSEKN